MGLPKQQVREVIDVYIQAWETQEPDRVVTIFTRSATYHERVLQDPIPDREAICRYWQSKVVQAQANIRCELLGLYLNGDTVIAVPCGDNGRLPWTRRYLGHHRPHLTFVSPTTGRFRWPCRTG